jgi:4-methyl-5(b-hydroxyethyl)-thiazole monophosphate biosynthesis
MLVGMATPQTTGATRAVLVPLATGFEEIEAVTIIDVLRRAGLVVRVAGLAAREVTGAHGITLRTDVHLAEVDARELAMLVLPGGMPGTTNLAADERILALVRELESSGRKVAAICAAPLVLERAGVLAGREVTSYPSVRGKLASAHVLPASTVVKSGPVITSQGVGTALAFALALVEELAGPAQARELAAALLVPAATR